MRNYIIILSSLLSCFAANAVEPVRYTTSIGAVFLEVQDPDFGAAWQAPDGSVWSHILGHENNQGIPKDDTVTRSDAVVLCESHHASLPSQKDIELFQTYLETYQYNHSTKAYTQSGQTDAKALFPESADSESNTAWTSTSTDTDRAATYHVTAGRMSSLGWVYSKLAVYCVKRATHNN